MNIDPTRFVVLAAALAAACGPAAAPQSPSAPQSSAPDAPPGTAPPAATPDPGTTNAPPDAPAGEPAADGPVPGEGDCDRFVAGACSEGASPRERCRSEARRLSRESGAPASASFVACIRSAAAGLPPGDPACAQARSKCDAARRDCEPTRAALDGCTRAAGESCANPSAMQSAAECVQRCAETVKLDGCKPEQCVRLGEKLQACVQRCGNPGADLEVCQQKKCETQQRAHDRCTELAASCTIPERCHTADLPACQRGHAVLDKCVAGR